MTLLKEALKYEKLGLSVVPVRTDGAKHPLVKWKEYQTVRPTIEQITDWWKQWPDANVGCITGEVSNLVVIDIDDPKMEYLVKEHYPTSVYQTTGRTGHLHAFYRPVNGVVPTEIKLGGYEVDIKGDKGFTVLAPSIHKNGRAYNLNICDGGWDNLADFPYEAVKKLSGKPEKSQGSNNFNPFTPGLYKVPTDDDSWDKHFFKMACSLQKRGYYKVEGLAIMMQFNQGNDPMSLERMEEKWESALSYIEEDTNKKKGSYVVLSWDELKETEFPERECLLTPWIKEQELTMIFAKAGVGKTHMSLGIAAAVSAGGSFLKWSAKKPVGVLFVDGEMAGSDIKNRLKAAEIEMGRPIGKLHVFTPDKQTKSMPDISTVEGQKTLEAFITDDTKLIILDNLSTLVRTGEENTSESWAKIQEWLLFLKSQGKSVLFIHHAGKNGDFRGASKMIDVVDAAMKLQRPEDYEMETGAYFQVSFQKARSLYGRDVEPFEAKQVRNVNGDFQWTMKTVVDSNRLKVQELLDEKVSVTDIAFKLGISKSAVSQHKKKLALNGRLQESSTILRKPGAEEVFKKITPGFREKKESRFVEDKSKDILEALNDVKDEALKETGIDLLVPEEPKPVVKPRRERSKIVPKDKPKVRRLLKKKAVIEEPTPVETKRKRRHGNR